MAGSHLLEVRTGIHCQFRRRLRDVPPIRSTPFLIAEALWAVIAAWRWWRAEKT